MVLVYALSFFFSSGYLELRLLKILFVKSFLEAVKLKLFKINAPLASCFSNYVVHRNFCYKTSDKKYERCFDRSTVIFMFKSMDKKFRIYIQFLKQWNEK